MKNNKFLKFLKYESLLKTNFFNFKRILFFWVISFLYINIFCNISITDNLLNWNNSGIQIIEHFSKIGILGLVCAFGLNSTWYLLAFLIIMFFACLEIFLEMFGLLGTYYYVGKKSNETSFGVLDYQNAFILFLKKSEFENKIKTNINIFYINLYKFLNKEKYRDINFYYFVFKNFQIKTLVDFVKKTKQIKYNIKRRSLCFQAPPEYQEFTMLASKINFHDFMSIINEKDQDNIKINFEKNILNKKITCFTKINKIENKQNRKKMI